MSLQPEELIDPREQEFWESDPSILRPPSTAQPDDDPRMVAIGLGIAAAVVGVGLVVRHYLKKKSPQTPEEARGLLMKAWDSTHKHVWKQLVTPSIVAAYEMGAGQMTITPKQLELLASLYADELGDYFHTTSVDALVDGFSAQLNKGFNDKIAWGRSAAGYGLDAKQTRGYIIGLVDQPKEAYEPTLVPAASQNAVDRAIMIRADRLGINESYKATQMGRNMVWVYLENSGELQGAQKQWHTAEDERVCPVCAPLDGVTIGLHDQFESANGERFWVPGVHPNCRCWISLVRSVGMGIDIAKAMSGDPYDRDYRGRFAENESRKANPIGISRPPIGTRQAALGESRTPLGAATGPLGWARAPIGQERPPIGERPVLGPVKELTLADVLEPPKIKFTQPKIKTKPKVEVENKVKTKVKTKSPVKSAAKVKTEAPVKIKAETPLKVEMHKTPLLVPASEFVLSNRADIKSYMRKRDGKNPIVHLSDLGFEADLKNPDKYSNEILAAFDHEAELAIPTLIQQHEDVSDTPPLAHDRADAAFGIKPNAEEGRLMREGTRPIQTKASLIFFELPSGWTGTDLTDVSTDDLRVGVANGFYEIDVDGIRNMNADGRTKAYPDVVKDAIETGSHHSVSNAYSLVGSIVVIPIRPVTGEPDESLILKRAPRLALRRKWRD